MKKSGEFKNDDLNSKRFGTFEDDDTQYHMIENPPIDSYIELVGLEVC